MAETTQDALLAKQEKALKEQQAAIMKQEAALAAARAELESQPWKGVLTEEELAELGKKLEEQRKQDYIVKEKELQGQKPGDFLVNTVNLSSFVHLSSSIQFTDNNAKAAELTALVEALLKPGIYPSVAEAYEEGVPVGTFILVDDPNTDEKEFTVKVVTEPVLDETLIEEA